MPEPDADTIPDDRLRLVFTCCHPALAQEAQVALTLRLVCGVATPDIAHAFLVAEPTMAARLTRAKKKIAAARIPYAVPPAEELPARVDAVLTVIHLLYATGHTAPRARTLVRDELTGRALDLARMLRVLLPGEREAAGLLALLLVHHARRATRTDLPGRLLRLEEQDRSAWDGELIAEADRLRRRPRSAPARPGASRCRRRSRALHAQAPSYAETDWPQILALYDELLRVWPSPGRRAQPRGRGRDGRRAGGRAGRGRGARARRPARDGYRYLPATKADLLHRLGRDAEAAEAYRAALALTDNAAEQEFLEEQIDR